MKTEQPQGAIQKKEIAGFSIETIDLMLRPVNYVTILVPLIEETPTGVGFHCWFQKVTPNGASEIVHQIMNQGSIPVDKVSWVTMPRQL